MAIVNTIEVLHKKSLESCLSPIHNRLRRRSDEVSRRLEKLRRGRKLGRWVGRIVSSGTLDRWQICCMGLKSRIIEIFWRCARQSWPSLQSLLQTLVLPLQILGESNTSGVDWKYCHPRFRTPSETFARRFLASDPLSILLLFLRSKGWAIALFVMMLLLFNVEEALQSKTVWFASWIVFPSGTGQRNTKFSPHFRGGM